MVGRDTLLPDTRSWALRDAVNSVAASLSGRQAVDQFKSGDFDLVLLCHATPPEETKRLCDLLRQHGPRIPVTAYSGLQDTFTETIVANEPSEPIATLHRNRAGCVIVRRQVFECDVCWAALCVSRSQSLSYVPRAVEAGALFPAAPRRHGPE